MKWFAVSLLGIRVKDKFRDVQLRGELLESKEG